MAPRQLKTLRYKFQLKIAKRWKQTAYGLHANLGMYFSTLLFLVALTGVFLGFWEITRKTLGWMTGSPPVKAEYIINPDPQLEKISLNQIIGLARDYVERTHRVDTQMEYINLGNEKNAAMNVSFLGPTKIWGMDSYSVIVNPYTGKVERDTTEKTGTTAEQIMSFTVAIHYGNWGDYFSPILGQITRFIWIFVALMPTFLIFTGFTFWKKPKWFPRKRT